MPATGKMFDSPVEQSELEETLNELILLVDKEVQVFQELLEALVAQYSSVIEEDVEAVLSNTALVRDLVDKSKALERDRKETTSQVSAQLGAEDPEPTLSGLIPLVEHKYATRLREHRDLLLSLSERVQTTNLRNKKLLNRSLNMVNKKLQLLSGGAGASVVYDNKGKEHTAGRELFSVHS